MKTKVVSSPWSTKLVLCISALGLQPDTQAQQPSGNRSGDPGPIPRPQPERQRDHRRAPNPATVPGIPSNVDVPAEVRTIDGTANHATDLTLGSADQAFIRLAAAFYADGSNSPAGPNRPSPRVVSNTVSAQVSTQTNARGASDFIWQWGQFLDHDLDETPTAVPAEAFPIAVPKGDPQFDPTSSGTAVIGLNRSSHETVAGVRQQVNAITSWIDASQVYGSDETRAFALRALDGSGRLKVTVNEQHGDLLPFNTAGVPNGPPGDAFFLAGDIRVNEQTGLTAIHTLFLREHNFWADLYKSANPSAADEEVYQFARLMVGAEMQAITYREFLPVLLGPGAIPAYTGYRANVNPAVSNEFATAAYRLGHSLLSPSLLRLDANNVVIAAGSLSLRNSFFNPTQITGEGIDVVLRGLAFQPAQELDEQVIDDVRNFLFGAPGQGGLDLPSLNIQRGRDHGLPSYNQMRQALGMPRARRFEDVNRNSTVARKLAAAYPTVDDVDLWIGGLAEADRQGSMVGEVFHRILVDQFTRVRDADRFWYQRHLSAELVRMVEQQSLATIIRRNTEIRGEIQDQVFIAPRRTGGRR